MLKDKPVHTNRQRMMRSHDDTAIDHASPVSILLRLTMLRLTGSEVDTDMESAVQCLCRLVFAACEDIAVQDWERHLQQGTLRELAAPRLLKKAVIQQMEEARAAGVDADFDQQTAPRSRKSFAQLAENDDMVDL